MDDIPMPFQVALPIEAGSAHIAVERLVARMRRLVLLQVPVLVCCVVAL